MRSTPRSLTLLLALLLGLPAACSHKRPLREPLAVPAPDATRLTGTTAPEVKERKRPPKWRDHPREKGDDIYGVGIVRGRGNRDVDLYRVRAEAVRSVVDYLRGRGMRVEAPRGLVPPLDVEPRAVFFEKIAHDKRADVWYCLARLDRDAEAHHLKRQVKEENERLARARKGLEAKAPEERLAAALAVLFHLDRRAEYRAQYRALTGQELDVPRRLRAARLEAAAREALAAYGVRLALSGDPVPGLAEGLTAVLGKVSLPVREDGAGEIELAVRRRDQWAGGRPFVYLDGELRLHLEGPAGPSRMEPLHVKGSGVDLDEAQAKAAEALTRSASEALLAALGRIAR